MMKKACFPTFQDVKLPLIRKKELNKEKSVRDIPLPYFVCSAYSSSLSS